MSCIGTAGHIDHGKSTLVKALTGIDPDRLAEEKERGMTIDLGFAHLQLTPELRLGFIDVPGHERFVKNMLAGAGGIACGAVVSTCIQSPARVAQQLARRVQVLQLAGFLRYFLTPPATQLVSQNSSFKGAVRVEHGFVIIRRPCKESRLGGRCSDITMAE